jgi:WD40 repeat protein
MPLLTRSRRGTWLLAGGVWLAACAVLWSKLPGVPRAEWDSGRPLCVVGALADGTLVTQDVLESRSQNHGAVRLWDPATETELLPTPLWHHLMKYVRLSPDRQRIIADIQGSLPEQPFHEARCYSHPTRGEFSITASWDSKDAEAAWQTVLAPDGLTVAIRKAILDPKSTSPGRVTKAWTEIWGCSPPRLRHSAEVYPLAYSPDGRFLIARDVSGAIGSGQSEPTASAVVVWDVESGEITRKFTLPPSFFPMQFDPARDTLVATGGSRLRPLKALFDGQTGAEIARIENAWTVESLPDSGDLVVVQRFADGYWTLGRWDRASKDYRFQIPDLWHPWQSVAYQVSSDGRIVAAAVGTGRKSIHATLRPILDSMKLGRLADIEASQEVLLLNMETGREMGRIPNVREIAFSPDGKAAYTAVNRKIQVWDIPPPKSQPWFAAGAALFALPIAFFAQWRVRKLGAA